jgi:hypothetical protein
MTRSPTFNRSTSAQVSVARGSAASGGLSDLVPGYRSLSKERVGAKHLCRKTQENQQMLEPMLTLGKRSGASHLDSLPLRLIPYSL